MLTATEHQGNLIIDFGDETNFTIPSLPGKQGIEALALLVGISLGTTLNDHGPERVMKDTDKLTKLTLSLEGRKNHKRAQAFENLRASQQEIVAQAGMLWNVQGGSIDAVHDLLDAAGGFPKALGRVMESCGLGTQFKLLKTWLDGVAQGQNSPEGSSPSTTIPDGGTSTSA